MKSRLLTLIAITLTPLGISARTAGVDTHTTSEDNIEVAYGRQSKTTVTGAMVDLGSGELLKSPTGSAASALAGALPGIFSVQMSGQPGASDPTLYVRGAGSLTDGASLPLILVDGVERSFFQMDPNEIESITVLKDASATAVYGLKGANGVILVTTRRGAEGRASIRVSSSFGLTQALRSIHGVGSYDYATLYGEAERNDNPRLSDKNLTFSPLVTEFFREGSDPIIFPDVDWNDYILKNFAWQTQHNLSVSGGSDKVRYFVSAGFLHQDGILQRHGCSYDPNFAYDRYNFRANLDIDLTGTTLLSINAGGIVGRRREPNATDLWNGLPECTPFASPGIVDGKYIYNPDNLLLPLKNQTNGLDLYYNRGYCTDTDNEMMFDATLKQDLGMLLKGLSLQVKGAYDAGYTVSVNRLPNGTDSYYTPMFLGSITQEGMDITDPLFNNTLVYRTSGVRGLHEPMSYDDSYSHGSKWYLEAGVNWAGSFENHNFDVLLLYNRDKARLPAVAGGLTTGYTGYVGRFSYNYNKKYLADFSAGCNGCESFAPDSRYGVFPAASIGWVASSEKFMKGVKFIDFLKFKASYGLTGNVPYPGAGGTWEKSVKQNYGFDLILGGSRFTLSADLFAEHRTDIFTPEGIAPVDAINSRGFEVQAGYNGRSGDFEWYVRGNASFAKNTIVCNDERSNGSHYGYLFDRFLQPEDFDAAGNLLKGADGKTLVPTLPIDNPKPGDVLYKDFSDDGKIDADDTTWFGYSARPEFVFGLLPGIKWKGFELSMQWTGAARASRLLSGAYRVPFGADNSSGLLSYLAEGRWQEGSEQDARFPRLTFENKEYDWNTDSDLWLMDASYLRLKLANLSYTLNDSAPLRRAGIGSAKFFINGYNLLTLFSPLAKMGIDPESGTSNGTSSYPNSRIYNIGFNLTF